MIETTQNKSNHDLKMCYFKTPEARHNEHICTGTYTSSPAAVSADRITTRCSLRQNKNSTPAESRSNSPPLHRARTTRVTRFSAGCARGPPGRARQRELKRGKAPAAASASAAPQDTGPQQHPRAAPGKGARGGGTRHGGHTRKPPPASNEHEAPSPAGTCCRRAERPSGPPSAQAGCVPRREGLTAAGRPRGTPQPCVRCACVPPRQDPAAAGPIPPLRAVARARREGRGPAPPRPAFPQRRLPAAAEPAGSPGNAAAGRWRAARCACAGAALKLGERAGGGRRGVLNP